MSLFEVPKVETERRLLTDRFVAPPFSVLDTKQGYWQKRKREWLNILGDLSATRDGQYGQVGNSSHADRINIYDNINGGTSNFDPVLAEIIYRWFCVPGGKIIDPFGGEQTKGVVAGVLGYEYEAVEIRKEQVDYNNEKTSKYKNVKYYCGDSNRIDELITDTGFDLCFTSPPYYDLEIYSEEDLSSLGTYEEFMENYKNIFKKCYDKMAETSFLVVKITEIRDRKTGMYRGFVPDNIRIMEEIGFKYYNEIILENTIGSLPIRAPRQFDAKRKVGKHHQNVLVFLKGTEEGIASKYPTMDEIMRL